MSVVVAKTHCGFWRRFWNCELVLLLVRALAVIMVGAIGGGGGWRFGQHSALELLDKSILFLLIELHFLLQMQELLVLFALLEFEQLDGVVAHQLGRRDQLVFARVGAEEGRLLHCVSGLVVLGALRME